MYVYRCISLSKTYVTAVKLDDAHAHTCTHSVGGAILVSLSPSGENDDQESGFNAGALFALGGAVL